MQPSPRFLWPFALGLSIVVHGVLVGAALFCPAEEQPVAPEAHVKLGRVSLAWRQPSRKAPALPDGPDMDAHLMAPISFQPGDRTSEEESVPPPLPASLPNPGNGIGSPGGQGGTRFFEVTTPAKRVIFVLDASASMGQGGRWQRACAELVRGVHSLPEDGQFQIIVYNRSPRWLLATHAGWQKRAVDLDQAIARALADLQPEGLTDHGPALRLALAQRPEALFFLTDADDLTWPLLADVSRWNRAGAVIHTFEFERPTGGRPQEGLLGQLARQTGGCYRVVGR